ncbi:hypothetical protein ANA_C11695 [Anabaena sp. 90]|nr:hypothetical protein ANA_C11695 [Anabaena sp. 90]
MQSDLDPVLCDFHPQQPIDYLCQQSQPPQELHQHHPPPVPIPGRDSSIFDVVNILGVQALGEEGVTESGVRSQESGVRSQEFRSHRVRSSVEGVTESGVRSQEFRSQEKKEERRKKKEENYPITNHQSPITHYQLPITNYQLPITRNLK